MSDAYLDLSRAPLLQHLIELRQRLLICMGIFAAVFLLSYTFAEQVYAFIVHPLEAAFSNASERRMIYTGLHEAFFTYLKLSAFTALLVTMPFVLIQVWRFLAPGLYKNEQRSIKPLFVLTPILFGLGAAVAFYGVMPLAWSFFLSFETIGATSGLAVELEARVSEYLSLVTKLVFAFGLSFELPVLLVVLAKIGAVSADSLRRHRKFAVVLTFLFAALLTPPDLISQIALGTPVLLLYELSIRFIEWSDADAIAKQRANAAQ